MAKSKKKSAQEQSDVQRVLQKSTEKAADGVEKIQRVEKQNAEMKRLLRLLPFQIFLLVADADRKIDPKEVAQFKEFLSRREKHCSNKYTRRMFHATVINYTALSNRYQGGHIKKDFSVVEKAMEYIGASVSNKMAAAIVDDLKNLAVAIAEASGGILGITSPVCKKEKAVITKLERVFNRIVKQGQIKEITEQPPLEV